MKTNIEQLVDGYTMLAIYLGLALLAVIFNVSLLSIVGFVLLILGMNKLIRYAKDNSDFRMARFALIAEIVAFSISMIYIMKVVFAYVDLNALDFNIDPYMIMEENRGILIVVLISTIIGRLLMYFITQGSMNVCRNELNNEALANQFDKFKFAVIALIVLDILSIIVPSVNVIGMYVGLAYTSILIVMFWQIRKQLILEINA